MTVEASTGARAAATHILWAALVCRLVDKGVLDTQDMRAIVQHARNEFVAESDRIGIDKSTGEVLAILDDLADGWSSQD